MLWTHGTADIVVADGAAWEIGTLGKLGAVPGWPGEEAFPPQPMVSQIRDVLERYRDAGGDVVMEIFEGSGHFPAIDARERFAASSSGLWPTRRASGRAGRQSYPGGGDGEAMGPRVLDQRHGRERRPARRRARGARVRPAARAREALGARADGPAPAPEPEPRRPRRFRVVEITTTQVLADDADARTTIAALRDVPSIVDVTISVWGDKTAATGC